MSIHDDAIAAATARLAALDQRHAQLKDAGQASAAALTLVARDAARAHLLRLQDQAWMATVCDRCCGSIHGKPRLSKSGKRYCTPCADHLVAQFYARKAAQDQTREARAERANEQVLTHGRWSPHHANPADA